MINDNSFNEKRKWQIALRRYIINKNKSTAYAPYFGIPIEGFRKWIELQFDENLHWNTFSKEWHFQHVLPVAYFNLDDESELRLCWNFVNIKVEKLNTQIKANKPELPIIKAYFNELFQQTGFEICDLIVKKINALPQHPLIPNGGQIDFLLEKLENIKVLSSFSEQNFERLNAGESIESLIAEQKLLKRFG